MNNELWTDIKTKLPPERVQVWLRKEDGTESKVFIEKDIELRRYIEMAYIDWRRA